MLSSAHIAGICYFTLCFNHHFIYLFLTHTIQDNDITRAGLSSEKGKTTSMFSSTRFEMVTWWEEAHNSAFHQEAESLGFVTARGHFTSISGWRACLNKHIKYAHQKDISPLPWQSPHSVTDSTVGFASCTWKALKKRKHWALRPVRLVLSWIQREVAAASKSFCYAVYENENIRTGSSSPGTTRGYNKDLNPQVFLIQIVLDIL